MFLNSFFNSLLRCRQHTNEMATISFQNIWKLVAAQSTPIYGYASRGHHEQKIKHSLAKFLS